MRTESFPGSRKSLKAYLLSHPLKMFYKIIYLGIHINECLLFTLQDSWRNLANAFTNERILLSLNPVHQVINSGKMVHFLIYSTKACQMEVGGEVNISLCCLLAENGKKPRKLIYFPYFDIFA